MNIVRTTVLAVWLISSFAPRGQAEVDAQVPQRAEHQRPVREAMGHAWLVYQLVCDTNVMKYIEKQASTDQNPDEKRVYENLLKLLPMIGQDVRDQYIIEKALGFVEMCKVEAFAQQLAYPGLILIIRYFRDSLQNPECHDCSQNIKSIFMSLSELLTEAHAKNLPLSSIEITYPDHTTTIPLTLEIFEELEKNQFLTSKLGRYWCVISKHGFVIDPEIIRLLGLDTGRFEYHLDKTSENIFRFLDPMKLVIKATPRPSSVDSFV